MKETKTEIDSEMAQSFDMKGKFGSALGPSEIHQAQKETEQRNLGDKYQYFSNQLAQNQTKIVENKLLKEI